METNINTAPRIRIEDMTLGQIQGLKKQIADELSGYIEGLSKIISDKFDVGVIGFSVDTERMWLSPEYKHESRVKYDVKIHFSKEDDISS